FDEFLPDAMDIAAPDINRCGGLLELQRIADSCDMYGIPLAPHNISSPLGTIAGVHFCASVPNVIALEYHANEVPWWDNLVSRTASTSPILEDGSIAVPEGPGLGIELDESIATDHLVSGETLF
ncbi:MAG: enolase C-terminal domain-like protein, partial [Halobacteriaceae archaeon]